MDINLILELIGTVGFPIAMVLALGIFVYKLWQQSVEREKALMSEIAENRKVNAQAIETLTLYAERIGTIEADVKEIKTIISHE
jgi:hypothetical protein